MFQVFMVCGIIAWEGIPRPIADHAYEVIKEKTSKFGMPMEVVTLNWLID
jgi:hypothetical protein